MQCPNCGKTVRSKNQCAHCGYDFDTGEVKESKRHRTDDVDNTQAYEPVEVDDDNVNTSAIEDSADEPETEPIADQEYRSVDVEYESEPRRKKRGGVGKVIWGIVKLILAVIIIFLLFLYGPRVIRQVVDMFNSEEQTVETNQPEDPDNAVVAPSDGESGNSETSDQEASEGEQVEEQSGEESGESAASGESTAETESGLSIVNQTVNTDNYPVIEVAIEFSDSLDTVDYDTFNLAVQNNDETTELNDEYSMTKEGNTLTVSFNDPSLDVLSTEPQEQTLMIEAEDADFNETLTYELPNVTVDQAVSDQFNDSVNANLSEFGDVTAAFYATGENDVPLVYDGQTVEAGNMISWFVLQGTLEAVDAGDLALDDAVTVNTDLVAEGDTGTVASAEADTSYTIQELANLIIQERDISAINHLIQELGGPNEFNVWLNESDYYATKINDLLSVNDSGQISGSVTNVQDLGNLLTNLANNSLISEEVDQTFKELLLQSAYTYKYPENGIEGVERRFELSSSDTNSAQQSYAGILETADTNYVVIQFVSNFEDPETVTNAMAQTSNELVTFTSTGELPSEESEEEAASDQVSIVEEAPAEETPVEQPPAEEPAPTTPSQGPGSGQYYEQSVSNTGETIALPDRAVVGESGQYVEPTWYWDEAQQTYLYSFE